MIDADKAELRELIARVTDRVDALAKIVGRQEARFIAIAMDLAEIKGRTDRLRTELDRHAIEAPALVPLDRLAEMQRNQVDLDISLRAVLNRMGLEKPTPPA